MKKSILIGVLAALMLFAFTACDNSGAGNIVYSVAVTGGGEKVYLPGETVDLSDYEFSLLNADGSASPANASDFVFESLVADAATIEGTYKGAQGSNYTVTLNVNVAKVDSVTISGTDYKDEYFATSDSDFQNIDLTGVTITAKYTDEKTGAKGEKEISAENPLVKPAITAAADQDEATWATTDNQLVVTYNGVKSNALAVKVVENPVSEIALAMTEGYTVYRDGKAAGTNKLAFATFDTDGSVKTPGIYAEAKYANGEVKKLITDIKFSNDSGATYSVSAVSGVTVPGTGESMPVFAQYVGKTVVVDFDREMEFNVPVANDAAVGIQVALASGKTFTTQTNLKTDTEIGAQFEVKYIMASDGDNDTASGSALTYKAEKDGYTITAPTSFDFTKNLEGDKVTFSFVADDFTDELVVTIGSAT